MSSISTRPQATFEILQTGQIVTAAAASVPLMGVSFPCKRVWVSSPTGATRVFVGDGGVVDGSGVELGPGEQVEIACNDAAEISVWDAVGGQKIGFFLLR